MIEVQKTELFDKWLKRITDSEVKSIIQMRLNRLKMGNFGDCNSVGASVFELRIHAGAGYRIYFKNTGKEIVLLLCGGDKSTQSADIKKAKELAKDE